MKDSDYLFKLIREELKDISDPVVAEKTARYFREEIKSYGVRNPLIRVISKKYMPLIINESKGFVFDLCESLWESGIIEESMVACDYSYAVRKHYEVKDFGRFEFWVRNYITNWASCDTFCNHTLGSFMMKFPEYLTRLSEWTRSENRWVRRASAVTLIIPARKGLFRDHIFATADALLHDPDDMVQKGYGWMLKEASKADMTDVFKFIMARKTTMPRTSLRYAIEKLPGEMKEEAMRKQPK